MGEVGGMDEGNEGDEVVEGLPRGVRLLKRSDVTRYTARVSCLEGVKTLGEFANTSDAGAAWDHEMCRRFSLSSIAPVLNNPTTHLGAGVGMASSDVQCVQSAEESGDAGIVEPLEALLSDNAWHDVNLCGVASGGLVSPLLPQDAAAFPFVFIVSIVILASLLSVHMFPNLISLHYVLTLRIILIVCTLQRTAGLAFVLSADDPSTTDRSSACFLNTLSSSSSAQPTSARHWVQPQHVRQRSVPFGHHRRAFIGDVVLALRRTTKFFYFLDAQVLDVASRRTRVAVSDAQGVAGKRSDFHVPLAYPASQLYSVMEENETPRIIARKFGLALPDVLAANAHLCQDEIQSRSKLRKGTVMVLPPFPEALDSELGTNAGKNLLDDYSGGASFSSSATAGLSHWDLEYLVEYLHGGQACGAREWLRPELLFQTRRARVVVSVPCKGLHVAPKCKGLHVSASLPSKQLPPQHLMPQDASPSQKCSPTKVQLVTSMLEGMSMDRWRFPKAKAAANDYETALRSLGTTHELRLV
jgi:hypothetical protein